MQWKPWQELPKRNLSGRGSVTDSQGSEKSCGGPPVQSLPKPFRSEHRRACPGFCVGTTDFETSDLTLSPHSPQCDHLQSGPRLRQRSIGSRLCGVDLRFSTRGSCTPRWVAPLRDVLASQLVEAVLIGRCQTSACAFSYFIHFLLGPAKRTRHHLPQMSAVLKLKPWPGATES